MYAGWRASERVASAHLESSSEHVPMTKMARKNEWLRSFQHRVSQTVILTAGPGPEFQKPVAKELITHYRLHFDGRGDPKLYSVPFRTVKSCILAYESVVYEEPLIPRRIRLPVDRRRHTLMVVRSRDEWAMVFLCWMKELRERQGRMSGINRNNLDW
jgi:hypothetical protein